MNTYTISRFAEMTGVHVKTLQRWDRKGKLVANRTHTNRRVYTDEHLRIATGLSTGNIDRKTVVYSRVSGAGQKDDLQSQIEALEKFCVANGYRVDEWLKDIGSGLNFKRKNFANLIIEVTHGKVERIIIAHKDRLCRFGFDLIKHICDSYGCEIVVMNIESLSPSEEMVQDVLSIIHCFSSRLYGLRTYKKKIAQELENESN